MPWGRAGAWVKSPFPPANPGPGCKTKFWENFGVKQTQPGDLSQILSSWLPPL